MTAKRPETGLGATNTPTPALGDTPGSADAAQGHVAVIGVLLHDVIARLARVEGNLETAVKHAQNEGAPLDALRLNERLAGIRTASRYLREAIERTDR